MIQPMVGDREPVAFLRYQEICFRDTKILKLQTMIVALFQSVKFVCTISKCSFSFSGRSAIRTAGLS